MEKEESRPFLSKTQQSLLRSTPNVLQTPSNIQTLSPSEDEQSPVPEAPIKRRKRRRVRRKKEDLGPQTVDEVPGVQKLVITKFTQHQLGCVVGEDVHGEDCWKFFHKELFEENLEMTGEDSEFADMKDDIANYPRSEILLGYIPHEVRPYDEFYICLTEEAEDIVMEMIEKMRQLEEERLNKCIYKEVGLWHTYGSSKEIDEVKDKPNRPLLVVEVETEYPIFTTQCSFGLRLVHQVRDGYTELLTTRTTFDNINKKQVDAEVQVTPALLDNEAQTFQTFPQNKSTQYKYEYEEVSEISQELEQDFQLFMNNRMNELDDNIHVTSYIDFYKDDYKELVKKEESTIVHLSGMIKEFTTLADVIVCRGKKITALSWHPMWTGTIAIAYGKYGIGDYVESKPTEDEVLQVMYNVAPVLLWSFSDTLRAKLFLETPRDVTTLSFCPYHDNILVGGLANGQVVIWDIKGKLENVETEEILSPAQQRYRILMNSLMEWMKNTKDPKVVRTTVISDPEYSHKSAITSIRWLSPFREATRSGKIMNIPENEDRTSLQFITASREGTLLIWDMLVKPVYSIGGYRPQRKLRRLKQRPPALVEEVSPWKEINRLFKPIFKILMFAPNTSRPLPLLVVSIAVPPLRYEEVDPNPNRKFSITDRIKYKPILERPKTTAINEIVAGSTEGDVVVGVWDGFEFNAGEVVNKETCRLISYARYHDGPVISLSRSYLFKEIVLSVGGKIFCLWDTKFPNQPFLWRRGKRRYTHCVWNNYRPTLFRLSREDGQIEMWHLNVRSDKYVDTRSVSGKSIGGVYTHPLMMKQNVLGMSDYNGFFRLFYVAQRLLASSAEEKMKTGRFYERQVARKKNFAKWQEQWHAKNVDWLKEKQEQDLLRRKLKDEERKKEKQQQEEEKEYLEKEEAKRVALSSEPEPGKYAEWAYEQWRLKEQERMNKVLLTKKALDIKVLEKQRQPLVKLTEAENKKRRKQKQRINNAGKIFDEAVAMLFPEAIEQKPPPPEDPYGGGDPMDIKVQHYQSYKQVEEIYDEYIQVHPHLTHFTWINTIKMGKERRKALDSYYTRNTHKERLIRDKDREMQEAEEAERMAELASRMPQEPQSLESIEYGVIGSQMSTVESDENKAADEDA